MEIAESFKQLFQAGSTPEHFRPTRLMYCVDRDEPEAAIDLRC